MNQLKQHQKLVFIKRRFLLSVWWDYKGIVYFELLPPNRTINSVVYIKQLTKLNNAIEEKRPELTNRKGVVFHHDNARPHTSLGKNYWSLVGMFCHIHHIVLTLHHLITFCFDLYKTPRMENFNNDDDIKSYLIQFFANKNHKFNERGITMLPERWQKVIDQNGQHITE